MAHVIYNKQTLHIKDRFNTERGAKTSFTRRGYSHNDYAITSIQDFYDNVDKDVEVINLMTDRKVIIKASRVGSACDPSTERYWTM